MVCFFFFKQKTAYEMRISDWSSDVCSSDLPVAHVGQGGRCRRGDENVGAGPARAQGDRPDRSRTRRRRAPRPRGRDRVAGRCDRTGAGPAGGAAARYAAGRARGKIPRDGARLAGIPPEPDRKSWRSIFTKTTSRERRRGLPCRAMAISLGRKQWEAFDELEDRKNIGGGLGGGRHRIYRRGRGAAEGDHNQDTYLDN